MKIQWNVYGIDKADIFDEYFDDDKPKKTNYESIISMSVDEMARFWFDDYPSHGGCRFCPAFKGKDENNCSICDGNCTENMTKWLLSEKSEG